MCDACGYNLTTIPMERRCPECGQPVIASLGPDARPGTMWQRRGELGRTVTWWRSFTRVILHPTEFGRQLQLVSPGMDDRRFLAWHLPLIYAIGMVGIIGFLTIAAGVDELTSDPFMALLVGSVFGCACAMVGCYS